MSNTSGILFYVKCVISTIIIGSALSFIIYGQFNAHRRIHLPPVVNVVLLFMAILFLAYFESGQVAVVNMRCGGLSHLVIHKSRDGSVVTLQLLLLSACLSISLCVCLSISLCLSHPHQLLLSHRSLLLSISLSVSVPVSVSVSVPAQSTRSKANNWKRLILMRTKYT